MQTTQKYQKVLDLTDLIDLINSGKSEFFISLNGGLRSSKDISYDNESEEFQVFHSIDGSIESLNHSEIMETNIGEALKVGALLVF